MADLSIYFLTFNCAQMMIEPETFASHLYSALPSSPSSTTIQPEILVLSLQEVAPLAAAFLGSKYLNEYLNRFRQAVAIAGRDAVYVNTATHKVGQVVCMVFMKKDVSNKLSWLETADVAVGYSGMGNKGAAGVRVGLRTHQEGGWNKNDMELTFVAAHLHPMENQFERRNEDWKTIVQNMVFRPPEEGMTRSEQEDDATRPLLQGFGDTSGSETRKRGLEGIYTPRSYLFFGGDLNYRTSDVKPTGNDFKSFPQPTEDQESSLHYSHLFERDQLSREKRKGKIFHGLQEAHIEFSPTYKYTNILATQEPAVKDDDVKSWDWAEHRWPSWTDRILYLDLPSWMKQNPTSSQLKILAYKALPRLRTSDHRPVALYLSIPFQPIVPPSNNQKDIRSQPPFSLNPQWESRRAAGRQKELVVGAGAFFVQTWDGNLVLLTLIFAALLVWFFTSR